MRKSRSTWAVEFLSRGDAGDIAKSIRESYDAENHTEGAAAYAAALKASNRSRESIADEAALLRAKLHGYMRWAWALDSVLTLVWPAARIGREQVLATAKAVEASKRAVATRVASGYGEVAAMIAREMRSKTPDCSRAAIVREVRERKAAGLLPNTRLPVHDRTIENTLRSMGL